MSTIDDGGPIAPMMTLGDRGEMVPVGGLSLRDWFAGMALAGLPIPPIGELNPMEFARGAYDIADAMLAARKEES